MSNIYKIGGIAAFINAVIAIASLSVALGLIGPAALTDSTKLVELAIHNPAPLVIQDLLKFVSAIVAVVLIAVLFSWLRNDAPKRMLFAIVFGVLAVLCLVSNASLSLFATSQAAQLTSITGYQVNGMIGLLGMATLFLNGIWYLLVSSSALHSNRLPKPLSYLGLGMGILSLLPPLGILVLLLSVVWSVWLGQVLLKGEDRA